MPAKNSFKDKIGFRNERLLVVERFVPTDDTQNENVSWKCLCDCGETIVLDTAQLVNSKRGRKSCGCATYEFIANGVRRRGRKPRQTALNIQYWGHKYNCRRASRDHLPRSDWERIVLQPCHYCGETDIRKYHPSRDKKMGGTYIKLTPEERDEYTLSINGVDRIDSSKGYEIDNCVPCCGECNTMKMDYSQDDMFHKVKLIYERHRLDLVIQTSSSVQP